jgi:cytidine deaminase
MDVQLTPVELKLVAHAKAGIVRYNTRRHLRNSLDTLYSFLITDGGDLYDGAAFEPNIAHATVCGERHAIANMVMNDGYTRKIESIIVADPVPRVQEKGTPPCGTCRHLIWQFSHPRTSVILMQYIQVRNESGGLSWTFPAIEKHATEDLYPYPYEPDPTLWHS